LNFLKGLILRNPGLKALALFLAIIVWLVVTNLQNPKQNRFFFVRLEVINLGPDLALRDNPQDFITLEVRGQSDKVAGLSSQQMRSYIDLRGAKAGTAVYDVMVDRDSIPHEVEVVEWTPTRIGLTVERTVGRRVRIEPSIVGDVADGYRLVGISVSPTTADLRGPQSQLEGLASIRTLPIDIAGANGGLVRRAKLDVPRGLVVVKPDLADVIIEIAERYVERSFDVPVSVVRLQRGLRSTVEPAQANLILYGPKNVVEGIENRDLAVSVDVRGLGAGVYPLFASARVPNSDLVSILQIRPNKFDVAIEKYDEVESGSLEDRGPEPGATGGGGIK
jgi:YbbR domain-containing protein